jgi:hypothetical protein
LKYEMQSAKIKQDLFDKVNKKIESKREIDERLRKELEVELGIKSPSSSIEEDSDTIVLTSVHPEMPIFWAWHIDEIWMILQPLYLLQTS